MQLKELYNHLHIKQIVDNGEIGYVLCNFGGADYYVSKTGTIYKNENGEIKELIAKNKVKAGVQPRLAVSVDLGTIEEKHREKIYTDYGYKIKTFKKTRKIQYNFYVYQIVAIVWLSFNGDEGFVINHKDNNSCNNCVNNLEIISTQENLIHAKALKVLRDTYILGNRAKMSGAGIIEIYDDYKKHKNAFLLYKQLSLANLIYF